MFLTVGGDFDDVLDELDTAQLLWSQWTQSVIRELIGVDFDPKLASSAQIEISAATEKACGFGIAYTLHLCEVAAHVAIRENIAATQSVQIGDNIVVPNGVLPTATVLPSSLGGSHSESGAHRQC